MTEDERRRLGLAPDPYIGAVLPGGPVQPFVERTATSGRTERGPELVEKVETIGGRRAAQEFAEAQERKVEALEARKRAEIEHQQAEVQAAEARAQVREHYEAQKREELENRAAQLAAARAQWARQREELAKAERAKGTGYWEDKSFGRRLLAAVLVGLAEGAHRGAGPSVARQMLEHQIEEDRLLKLSKWEDARRRAAEAGGIVGDVEREREQAIQAIDNMQIVDLQKVADDLELIKKKVPVGHIAIDEQIADVLAMKAEKERKQEADFAATITAPSVVRTFSGTERTVEGERQAAKGEETSVAQDSAGNIVPVAKDQAKDLAESKAKIDALAAAVSRAVAFADDSERSGSFGRIPSIGSNARAREDIERSLAQILVTGVQGADRKQALEQAKSRFTVGPHVKMDEWRANIVRVLQEEQQRHDAAVMAASVRAQGASTHTGGTDRDASAWARANPSDPRAIKIMDIIRRKYAGK